MVAFGDRGAWYELHIGILKSGARVCTFLVFAEQEEESYFRTTTIPPWSSQQNRVR
jgi:hypothetical protein